MHTVVDDIPILERREAPPADAPRPWTAWVWRGSVVGVFPGGGPALVGRARMLACLSGEPVTVYEIDRRLGRPVLGSRVEPARLGWRDIDRFEAARA